MTDDIDNQPSPASPRSRTYNFCSRCGMVMSGVTCGFCKDLKRVEPKEKPGRYFGKVRIG